MRHTVFYGSGIGFSLVFQKAVSQLSPFRKHYHSQSVLGRLESLPWGGSGVVVLDHACDRLNHKGSGIGFSLVFEKGTARSNGKAYCGIGEILLAYAHASTPRRARQPAASQPFRTQSAAK